MKRLVVSAAVLLGACGGDTSNEEPVLCTTELRPGITLTVLEDATGAPASCGAQALITASGYSEAVRHPPMIPNCADTLPLSGAHERPGVYNVTVSKPGFQDAALTNLVVAAGVCHVTTVTATVRLIRL